MKKKNNFKIGYALNRTYEIICGFSRSLLHEFFFLNNSKYKKSNTICLVLFHLLIGGKGRKEFRLTKYREHVNRISIH